MKAVVWGTIVCLMLAGVCFGCAQFVVEYNEEFFNASLGFLGLAGICPVIGGLVVAGNRVCVVLEAGRLRRAEEKAELKRRHDQEAIDAERKRRAEELKAYRTKPKKSEGDVETDVAGPSAEEDAEARRRLVARSMQPRAEVSMGAVPLSSRALVYQCLSVAALACFALVPQYAVFVKLNGIEAISSAVKYMHTQEFPRGYVPFLLLLPLMLTLGVVSAFLRSAGGMLCSYVSVLVLQVIVFVGFYPEKTGTKDEAKRALEELASFMVGFQYGYYLVAVLGAVIVGMLTTRLCMDRRLPVLLPLPGGALGRASEPPGAQRTR